MIPTTLTSLQHPLVKHLVRLRQNRDYREECGSVIIEGHKLVEEVSRHHRPKLIATYDLSFIPEGIQPEKVLLVNEAIMHKISSTTTPEGIVAEIAMPASATLLQAQWIIALDGVSDPGNLGTLLRTALALGWEGAFILPNSCDPYNDKALRAAKGATFHLPLAYGTWEDLQGIIKANQLTPLVADMSGDSIEKIKAKRPLLIMGNESQGVSSQALQQGKKVKIPMTGPMESLNVGVAGSILMYALKSPGAS